MKTLREMMDIIESAQTVDEDGYELKMTDQWDYDDVDDDNEYGGVVVYEFEVLKNGQRIGTARGDNYMGDLSIELDSGKSMKLDSIYQESHPLIQQFKKFLTGLDEETRGIDDPDRAREMSKQAWERVHAKGKNAFDRFATRMSARALDNVKIDRKTGKVVDEEQLEETEVDPVRRIEELFRDKQ